MSDGVECFLGSFATALQKWETVEEVERGCSAIRGVLHSTSVVGGGKLFSLDCTGGQPRLVETSYVSVDAEVGLHDEAACRLAAVGCRGDKQQYGLRASSSCQGQGLSCEELSNVSEVGEASSVVGVGDSRQDVPVEVVRGKHYESNRRKRLSRRNKRKEVPTRVCVDSIRDWRNPTGASAKSEPDQNVPTFREFAERKADSEVFDQRCLDLEERLADEVAVKSAKRTLNEKWAMENKLAVAKAKRALEVLEAQDLQAEIKKQSTYLKLQTEKNMVGMEKAHQFLKRTGNVPGFAQTVVSDGGLTDGSSASPISPGECTISPDSSASMKEFRELAKKCADLEAKLDQFHKMTKIHPDYIELYKKQTWTINSENIRILDEMYPQGHALNPIPDYENYDAPTHGELIVGRDEEYFPY